jgi:hypothetical protein
MIRPLQITSRDLVLIAAITPPDIAARNPRRLVATGQGDTAYWSISLSVMPENPARR